MLSALEEFSLQGGLQKQNGLGPCPGRKEGKGVAEVALLCSFLKHLPRSQVRRGSSTCRRPLPPATSATATRVPRAWAQAGSLSLQERGLEGPGPHRWRGGRWIVGKGQLWPQEGQVDTTEAGWPVPSPSRTRLLPGCVLSSRRVCRVPCFPARRAGLFPLCEMFLRTQGPGAAGTSQQGVSADRWVSAVLRGEEMLCCLHRDSWPRNSRVFLLFKHLDLRFI